MSTDAPRILAGNGHFYRQTEKGSVWRYSLTDRPVPGGRDVTLREHAPAGRVDADGRLYFPRLLAIADPALAQIAESAGPHEVMVPWHKWEVSADRVVSMHAPEMLPHLLLNGRQSADALGIPHNTFRHARWRGYAPAPVVILSDGFLPLWSTGVLREWQRWAGRE